jgi:hypothetical protein
MTTCFGCYSHFQVLHNTTILQLFAVFAYWQKLNKTKLWWTVNTIQYRWSAGIRVRHFHSSTTTRRSSVLWWGSSPWRLTFRPGPFPHLPFSSEFFSAALQRVSWLAGRSTALLTQSTAQLFCLDIQIYIWWDSGGGGVNSGWTEETLSFVFL